MISAERTYFFGNWKMHGSHHNVKAFACHFQKFQPALNHEIVLFVPFPYLMAIKGIFPSLGAQDCSIHESGNITGDVGAAMLKDMGVKYVLVGHSERRHYYHESQQILLQKYKRILEQHLVPVICLGESLEERGHQLTLKVLKDQIAPFLTDDEPKIFAYEPLWAIGTGTHARPDQLRDVYVFLKEMTSAPLLYGGSVTPQNAHSLLDVPGINGLLVGQASRDPLSWKALLTNQQNTIF